MSDPANRLGGETSPYLLQHADNPVDWWPWCEDAFAEARARDRPLLISIGYSACHWCHVMAHESFEDPETAARMNELFVPVKVDREEHPDVDALYMEATQAMTGHGGWPMTVFATPGGEPFFCGTYFPRDRRGGMASFADVMAAVDEAWRDRRDQVHEQAAQVVDALGRAASLEAGDQPDLETLGAATGALVARLDPEWGGFGGAPKFPPTGALEILLAHHQRTGAREELDAVTTTLDAMAAGGIHDHLGGGFARYSVDSQWLVPHFEKMLHDQALLLRAYVHAWQVTGHDRYRVVADGIVEYVLRDLRHADGGFLSAEDADSEGVEGRFYVWTPAEVRAVAGDDAEAAIRRWGVTDAGNFEGANVLHLAHREDWAEGWPPPPPVERARQALLEARGQRVRPGLDDKVLTEWNGLMLAALCEAAQATGDDAWATEAVRTGEFLVANLHDGAGRWWRSWKEGRARHRGVAHDHVAMVDALTRLHELTGRQRWLRLAAETAGHLLDSFWDLDRGGLLTTPNDSDDLVVRPKDLLDGATPSANGLAAHALARLAALTGDSRWGDAADSILRLLGAVARQHPTAAARALEATLVRRDGAEIVVTGDRPDLVAEVRRRHLPGAVLTWGERDGSPLWAGRDDGLAYVCRGYTCQAPTGDPAELAATLDAL